ncbi:MAG TPA: hypothetical protein VKX46_20480 [Ktedonobacteraceae bacterium]|nr:hypothetical protein [Ktedonobacteraceae bacterium]
MSSKREEAVLRITARYVEELQSGRQPVLSEYLGRYPQYASAIADFVAYYHAVEEEHRAAALQQEEPQAIPIATLLQASDGRLLAAQQLAALLDLSIDIVQALEQREVAAETIPSVLHERLAAALDCPVNTIRAYFAELPRAQESSRRLPFQVAEGRAPYPPGILSGSEQSFCHLLDASEQLSPASKASWRAILAREQL